METLPTQRVQLGEGYHAFILHGSPNKIAGPPP